MSSLMLSVPIGYWKIPFGEVLTIVKCPYDYLSCIGGSTDLSNSNVTVEMLSGIYCHNTFKGVLCSKPIDNHYIDWTNRDSIACSDSFTIISIFLVIPLLFILPLTLCFYSGRNVDMKNRLLTKLELDNHKHNNESSYRSANIMLEDKKKRYKYDDTRSENSTICSHPSIGNIYGDYAKSDSSISTFENNPVRKSKNITTINSIGNNVNNKVDTSEDNDSKILMDLMELKLLIFSLQLSASLPNYLSCTLPFVTSKLLQIIGLLSLTSPLLIPWNCIDNFSYQDIMEMFTFGIFIATVIGILMFMIEISLANKQIVKKSDYRKFRNKCMFRYCTVFFIGVYILIGGVTEVALGSIFCVNVDPDGFYPPNSANVLWNDTNINCISNEYNFGLLWAIGVLIIFSAGSQLISGAMLYCYSNNYLNIRKRGTKNKNKEIIMISVLYYGYKQEGLCLYWEIVHNIYKVFMMAVLPQLPNIDPWLKIIIAFGVTLSFYQFSRYFRAHLNEHNQLFESISCYQIMLLQSGALLLQFQDSTIVTILIDIFQSATVLSVPMYYLYIRFYKKSSINNIKSIIANTSDKILTDVSKKILSSTNSFRSSNGSDKHSNSGKFIGNRRMMTEENDLLFKVDSNYYLNEEIVSIYSGNKKFTQSIYSINSNEYMDDKDTEGMDYTDGMCITKTLTKICNFMEDSSSCSLDSSDLKSLNLYFPYDIESTKNPNKSFKKLNVHEDLEEFTTMSQNEWFQIPSGSEKSEKSNTSTL